MKFAIVLLLLLPSAVLPAQSKEDSPAVRKTQKILTKAHSLRPYFFMTKDDDGIFFMFSKINFLRKFKGYGIAYLSRDGKTAQSANLPLTFKGKELNYKNIIYIDNRMHLLTSFYNTGSDRFTVFKQEISPTTLLPVSELQELYSEDLSRKNLQLSTSTRMKNGGEEVVMQRRFYDEKNGLTERLEFYYYNADMMETGMRSMNTSDLPENTSLGIARYDKEGRLYLYQSAKTPKSSQNNSKTYDYNILIVAPGESAYTTAKLKLDGYSMHRFKYKWTEDKLFIAGTYKEEGSKNKMIGLFLKSYTLPDMKPDKEILMPLTVKTKGYGVAFRDLADKDQAPYGKKLSYFNINAIAEAEDGSIYLSGNNLQNKLITESTQKMLRKEYKSIESETTSNLITARIDSSGRPEWIKKIPMSSGFSDPFYRHSGAKGFTYENNFYLVFNDHSRSQNKYDKAPTMGLLSALTSNRLVKITPAGELSDHSVFGKPGLSTFFYASGSYFDSKNGCLYTYLERGSQKFQCYITEF